MFNVLIIEIFIHLKSGKDLCSHVTKNLPKGYSGLETMTQMMDNYLDNYEGD